MDQTRMMMDQIARHQERLAHFGQDQLLRFLPELTSVECAALLSDLEAVTDDALLRIQKLFGSEGSPQATETESLDADSLSEPAMFATGADLQDSPTATDTGEELLRSGQTAVLIAAGGQGSRLGFDHPKGCYPIGPSSGATLFQILLEKVVAASRLYQTNIPVVILASPATLDETREFLGQRNWFGIAPACRNLLCQGTMPAVDMRTGRILLSQRHQVAASPNGHGGHLAVMVNSGLLDSLAGQGISTLFYCQVDNPLAPLCDPELLGRHQLTSAELSVLVTPKTSPADKVGTVIAINAVPQIIEYTLIPESIAAQRTDDGRLKYRAANTGIHIFNTEFLRREAAAFEQLAYHQARKKVAFINDDGILETPDEPNAIKFERFIFDVFPFSRNTVLLEVDPAECFAPVKNATGLDSPETVRQQLASVHRKWLAKRGFRFDQGISVEVSPLFTATSSDDQKKKVATSINELRNRGDNLYLS